MYLRTGGVVSRVFNALALLGQSVDFCVNLCHELRLALHNQDILDNY